MIKLFSRSYLFLYLAVVAKLIEAAFITSHFFYNHLSQFTLMVIMISPIIGLIFAIVDSKKAAIAFNIFFILLFTPLALLNFWILTFGK